MLDAARESFERAREAAAALLACAEQRRGQTFPEIRCQGLAEQRLQAVAQLSQAQATLARVDTLRAANHAPAIEGIGIGPAQVAMRGAMETMRAAMELRARQLTADTVGATVGGLTAIAAARKRPKGKVDVSSTGLGVADRDLATTAAVQRQKGNCDAPAHQRSSTPNGMKTGATPLRTVRAIRTAARPSSADHRVSREELTTPADTTRS